MATSHGPRGGPYPDEGGRLRAGQAAQDQGQHAEHCGVPRPGVILIDQLKQIRIDGGARDIDTAVYYNRVFKKDYLVAMNFSGSGSDDPESRCSRATPAARCATRTATATRRSTALFEAQSRRPTRRSAGRWCGRRPASSRRTSPARSSSTRWRPAAGSPRQGTTLSRTNSIYNGWRFEDIWLDR